MTHFDKTFRTYFDTLNKPRFEEIVKYRFGLDDGQSKTLADVGRQFNFTKERSRQILFIVLHGLKRVMNTSYEAVGESLKDQSLIPFSQVTPLILKHCKKNLPYFENRVDFVMAIFGYDNVYRDGEKVYYIKNNKNLLNRSSKS